VCIVVGESRRARANVLVEDAGLMSDPNATAQIKMSKAKATVKAKGTRRPRLLQGELDFREKTHGGRRDGAGRKKKPGNHDPAHRTRPKLRKDRPVHVVMRVGRDVPRLRKGRAYQAIRRSLVRCLGNDAFRVCHISIQGNHLHFIVEAKDERALSAGMQRLNILTARALNRELGRKGSVFAFRYHATQITSPKQARHCLAYVLNNWRRHSEDESSQRAQLAALDPYASGLSFDGWDAPPFAIPDDFTPLPVAAPSTWLLRVGWRKHGLIDPREVPGPMQRGVTSH
jgi:REP element-mobilizing transposase RayT